MINESKETGLRLLEKGKRGIFQMIFSRSGLILVLLAIQVLFLFSIFHWFEAFLPHIYGGVVIFTVFMVLYLLNSSMDPTAKITWLVTVMLLPVFGALLFLYTQKNFGHRTLQKRYAQLNEETEHSLEQDPAIEQALEQARSRVPQPCPAMSGAAAATRSTTTPLSPTSPWARINSTKC